MHGVGIGSVTQGVLTEWKKEYKYELYAQHTKATLAHPYSGFGNAVYARQQDLSF